MLNTEKYKPILLEAIEKVGKLVPIPSELQCPIECPNCGSCKEACPFNPSLDLNGRLECVYNRSTHDPFFGNKEFDAHVYYYKDQKRKVDKLSTVSGIFPFKGQYPTYFILLSCTLMVDENLTADEVLFVYSQYLEEKNIEGSKLPNRSTLYRWRKKYLVFKEKSQSNSKNIKYAHIFSPLDVLKNACKTVTETASKVAGEVFPILHSYLQSLKKLIRFSDLVVDIDHLVKSRKAS